MKKIISLIMAFILLSGIYVKADTADYGENYDTFFENGFYGLLDDDTLQRLYENGVSPESATWVNNLEIKNIFSFIVSLIKGDIKKPFSALMSIIAVILMLAAFNSYGNPKYGDTATVTATAVIALIVTVDIFSCCSATENAIKLCAGFMISFVPAFAAVVAASGRTLTAASSGTVLLLAANAVSSFSAYGVLPLMGGYLSISMISGISPLVSKLSVADTVKKVTLWALSLLSTVFLGVLSVQTAVNSAADSVSIKAAKFILGTSVPVAGGALSEAASTVSASLSLLKSSAGIYAVVAITAIMLPVIIDILLWRCCFAVGATLCDFMGENKVSVLLRSIDGVLSCLMGIILLITAIFVISLTVVVSAGMGV